ncbi:hypothetical protein [Actinomadura madurae]|uniref:hypothetical protein n=1 Tax=Actinomadura madurae TaxID=1993 RepID=UPI000D9919C7|nr:hypothetical protein [Actinomadura madurae]SPT51173.1 Uncharacterised protein [Actinomadura madurae]
MDYDTVATFILTAAAGSLGATRTARRLDADRLRRWFAYLVFAVAAFIAAQVREPGGVRMIMPRRT